MKEWEDYYEILGVNPDASQKEIKKAYRENAFIYHPDRIQGLSESVRKRAEEKMKKVIQAHEVLGDSQKRQQYHSEWLQKKGGTVTARQGYQVPKPKPVADPSVIRFTNVSAHTVKTKSFIIRNEGGPYSEINVSNPKTWVELVDYTSLSDSDELPLEVKIKAEGKDWGKTYSDVIRVRLDNEEAHVRVELRTKSKPVRKKASAQRKTYIQQRTCTQQTTHAGPIPQACVGPVSQPLTHSRSAPQTSPVVLSRKMAGLMKWVLVLAILGLVIGITRHFLRKIEKVSGIYSVPTRVQKTIPNTPSLKGAFSSKPAFLKNKAYYESTLEKNIPQFKKKLENWIKRYFPDIEPFSPIASNYLVLEDYTEAGTDIWVIGCSSGGYGHIFHSFDGGDNWKEIYRGPKGFYPFIIYFSGETKGWIGGKGGLLYTNNSGKHWTVRSGSPGKGIGGWISEFWFFEKEHLKIQLRNKAQYESFDGGISWKRTVIGYEDP